MAGVEEIRSVQDLEKRLSSVSFPFGEVEPQSVSEWFTTRELFLVSALALTSALIGKTTLEVFPSYEEKGPGGRRIKKGWGCSSSRLGV